MGCLIEMFFEIFLEGIIELILYCYIKLMHLIIPNKMFSEKEIKNIKNFCTTVAAILLIVLIIGLLLLLGADPFIKNIGKYMTYIPLSIIVLQILLGIIVKIGRAFKK